MRTPWIALLAAALLSSTAALPALADDTLYAQLGGRAGIARIVDGATELYRTDPRIKDDFDNISFDWFKARLTDFLCQLADGPCKYKGRSMAASHKGLHLTRAKFNAAAEDLQIAMEQAGVSYRMQNRLLARLAPMQRDIVTR
jgi:hemoglobin